MALPVPGKVSLKTPSAELGDRIFVVGGKLLLLLLLGVAVLMPLLAIFWPKKIRALSPLQQPCPKAPGLRLLGSASQTAWWTRAFVNLTA